MMNNLETDDWQLRMMILGGSISQMVSVIAELGIADILCEQPKDVKYLSNLLEIHESSLYRLLRTGASLDLLREVAPQKFALTPLSGYLRSDHPQSLRNYAILKGREWSRTASTGLMETMKTGKSSFHHIYGKGIFDYLESTDDAKLYHQSIGGISCFQDPFIVESYDFSTFENVIDIGAGMGSLLGSILTANPNLNGIHFDQPVATQVAKKHFKRVGIDHRCTFISGDFLSQIPVVADVYLLKNILHDWSDKDAVSILGNIRKSIPKQGRLLIIEIILPNGTKPHSRILMDLEMLIYYGGQERTEKEYDKLINSTGFHLNQSLSTGTDVSILECTPI